MAKKVQVVLLVEPETATKLDVLRIVMGALRAEVGRMALEGITLEQLERTHAERIGRLALVAAAHGKTLAEYAHEYARQYSRVYGPTLEELEAALTPAQRKRMIAASA